MNQSHSYAILCALCRVPSPTSRLTGCKHATLKASPYTQSIPPCTHRDPSSATNTLMLLPPRSAHIAPPHPLTQALHRTNIALLLTGTHPAHRGRSVDDQSTIGLHSTHSIRYTHSTMDMPQNTPVHIHCGDARPTMHHTTNTGMSSPSIFSSARFGRYVLTRFLADANFHGHRPTVTIRPPDYTHIPKTPYPTTRFIPYRVPCLPQHTH